MVNKYLTNIADTEQKSKTSEYTHRTALENLFNEIKNNNSIQIHQESRDNNTADKPDFRISKETVSYVMLVAIMYKITSIYQIDAYKI